MRVAVLASGRGTNFDALAKASREGRLDVDPVVVFSNKTRAPVLQKARDAGVAVETLVPRGFESREAFDEAVLARLEPYRVEGAILAGYMRIVTPAFLGGFPRGVLNVHPSLLPAFPGINAVRQAWEYGVKVTGCTVHFVDEHVDHGPIVMQRALEVLHDDSPESLADRLSPLEHEALIAAANVWGSGRYRMDGRRVVVDPAA